MDSCLVNLCLVLKEVGGLGFGVGFYNKVRVDWFVGFFRVCDFEDWIMWFVF